MGDVITRFKLETTQFDSKLRDSAKALQNIAHQAELGGKDFNDFSQKAIETARALGTVQSGANNTKDKLKDLVGSYNDAAKAYNSLSETAKQGEFGKAMAASLNQLQVRIKETKEDLYGLGDAMKGNEGLFGGEGFKGMLQVFGGNMMTKAAELAAQLGSEIIEITKASGELAKEAEGVTIAFERLGRPGLLDELKAATHDTVSEFELMKAAVQFNDFKLPLSELGTMLAFAQQKAKDTGQSVDYMVSSIVTGLGRKSLMILDNLGLSASEVKERMKETGDMTKAVGEIIREQMEKAGDYVDTASDKASRANAKLQDEMLALGNAMKETFGVSSVDDFATAIKTELVGAITFTIETINEAKQAWKGLMGMMGVSSPASQPQGYFKKGAVMPNGTYVEQTDSNGNVRGGYWNNGEIAWNSAGVEIVGTKRDKTKTKTKTPKTGGSGKKNLPEYSDFSKLLFKNGSQDLQAEAPFTSVFSMLKDKSEFDPENILGSKSAWESYKDTITETVGSVGESFNNLTTFTKDFKPFVDEQKKMTEAAKQNQMAMGLASQAVGAFGSALSSMEDPGAKAAGTVMQALGSIALGFAMASAQANTAGTGWGWLAWVAAGLAAMTTAISTVHSLTGYAQGGIVKGNSYSGDNIYGGPDAMVNAGELVLTKAQQSTLASALQGNGLQNMNIAGRIKGTDIILSIDRSLKLEGKQLLTWGR